MPCGIGVYYKASWSVNTFKYLHPSLPATATGNGLNIRSLSPYSVGKRVVLSSSFPTIGGLWLRDRFYVRIFDNGERQLGFSVLLDDGGLGSSATAGTILAPGRGRSECASPNAAMMSRRMHGARGDASTSFRQGFMSAIETAGLSGNPRSDLTLTHTG